MTGKKGMSHAHYTMEYKNKAVRRIIDEEISLKGFGGNMESTVPWFNIGKAKQKTARRP